MFTISAQTMAALQALAFRQADERLAARARVRLPDRAAAWSGPALAALAARTRLLAHSHDIEGESDIARLFDLVLVYGEEVLDAPWVSDVLALPMLAGGEKLTLLAGRVRPQLPWF